MGAANLLLPLQDALSKQVLAVLPIPQLLLVRSLAGFVLALALGRQPLLERAMRTRLKGAMILRSLVMLAGWLTFCEAIRHLPLAQATTIYFASPILVTLAAGPILKERVTPSQWAAVAIGFTGVWLASDLASFEVSDAVLMAFLSTGCWAAALLMLRAVSQQEGSLIQVLFANGTFVVATAPLVLFQPIGADGRQIAFAAAVGLVGGVGQLALYAAARRLPASVLATLEYSAILTAFALGYVMFGERPSLAVSLGAALVLVSGIAAVAIGTSRPVEDVTVVAVPEPGVEAAHRPPTAIPLPKQKESLMPLSSHDLVVNVIAKTRFPFPGQAHWPSDYVTLTNVPERRRSIDVDGAAYYPDIVILDGTGRIREIGEVEMSLDADKLPYLQAASLVADDDTSAKVRHFFLYVPAGMEAAAQQLLDDNGISYAGVRGFTMAADGRVGIVPFATPGDAYDHQVTDPQTA
nr:DMT family transporter [Mangrovicella endophytica]